MAEPTSQDHRLAKLLAMERNCGGDCGNSAASSSHHPFRAIYASPGLWGSLAPFLAGAITLSAAVSVVKWGSLVIAAVYFLFVWLIQPIEIALRLDESSLIAAILAAAVVAFLCFGGPEAVTPQPDSSAGPDAASRARQNG